MTVLKFKESIQKGVVVTEFYAKWCEPCKLLTPIFDNLSEEMKGSTNFLKVDIDHNLELAREHRVSSVPTILIFKNGELVDSLVGFTPKDILKNRIEAHSN